MRAMADRSDNRSDEPSPATAGRPAWKSWLRELLVTAAIAAVVLVVVGWMQRERQRGGGGALPVATASPTFVLQGLDGRVVSSESLRGKPTVLVFWATWCGVCRDEMPDLERFAAGSEGRYNVVAVSRESAAVLRRWVAEHPSAIPVAQDVGGKASAAYRIESLPTHVIIDREGKIVHDFSGAADPAILDEHMRRLM